MQRNIDSLVGYTMGATDGEIGKVMEFYFDDDTWTIRYLIIKTGSWLFGRKVLLSPDALIKNSWKTGTFFVNLSKEQVANSPDIDTDKPVSRQQEMELYEHYPWQDYWGGGYYAGGIWGVTYPTSILNEKIANVPESNGIITEDDQHLRSTRAVTGYNIHATDGIIGHVTDFIFDSASWKLLYLVVDTHHWFGEKKVLVEIQHIKEVRWANSQIMVDVAMDAIKNCRPFDEQEFAYAETAHVTDKKPAMQPGWAHL
jgi:uncharacterized protein YrrD